MRNLYATIEKTLWQIFIQLEYSLFHHNSFKEWPAPPALSWALSYIFRLPLP